MARVVVGLSGGVDSSVAAYLLKQQGHDVVGLFMINWHDTVGTLEGECTWYDDRLFAEMVAKRLDIPLHTVDLSEEYRRRVVDYMFSEYERGRTPNPDVLCNREIKFDVFLKEALKLGADYVATGHYCRKEEHVRNGRTVYSLLAGTDPSKDQSYFLCQLSQEQLSRALFPVGGLLKSEVRRIAAEQHLATAKRKDSQGICFVGKVDLPVFLQQKIAAREGNIHEILPSWRGYSVVRGDDVAALAEPYRYTVRDGKKIGEHNGMAMPEFGESAGGADSALVIIRPDLSDVIDAAEDGNQLEFRISAFDDFELFRPHRTEQNQTAAVVQNRECGFDVNVQIDQLPAQYAVTFRHDRLRRLSEVLRQRQPYLLRVRHPRYLRPCR